VFEIFLQGDLKDSPVFQNPHDNVSGLGDHYQVVRKSPGGPNLTRGSNKVTPIIRDEIHRQPFRSI